MGLLDQFSALPAEQQQAINSGLLSMAGALLTPQWKGGGMGAAFQAFPAAIDRAQQQSRQNKMLTLQEQQLGLQTDEAKRKAEAQARQQAALAALLADPKFANNPAIRAAASGVPKDVAELAFPKPTTVSPGGALVGADGKVVYQAPYKPDAPTELEKLIAARDKLPEGSPVRPLFDQAISKATTHAPAATAISYGSPVPVQLADGSIGYAQPGNRPGAPPQMMTDPSGKPLTKPPANLPEQQQKQIIGVQNLQSAIQEYRDQLASFGPLDWAKPDARARMGVKYNNMMLQAKEAYNLGVLNGPDFQILTSVVTDPRSLTGIVTSKEALDQQASELSRIMAGIGQTAATVRTRGQPYSAKPAGGKSPAVPKISGDAEFDALPSGAEFIAPDGSRRRKP